MIYVIQINVKYVFHKIYQVHIFQLFKDILYIPGGWDLERIALSYELQLPSNHTISKFYIFVHIDKIYVGTVTHHFSHISTRVMVLVFTPKFRFRSISWEKNGQNYTWDRYSLFSQTCTRVMALDLCQNFRFRSISWEQTDRFWPNFI